jgi:hypothetical protein
MFNWTTTTLINEIPENFIVNPKDKDGNAITDRVRIGKHLFEKRWVESIRKATGHKHELCKATIELKDLDFGTASVARLYIYVGLEGSEESIYANDWYRKGMPLSVSFAVNSDAAKMAEAIADTIKTFNVFTKVKKVLDVKADGTKVIIEGTHEYQRLNKIAILVEDTSEANILHEEKVLVEYERNRKEAKDVVKIDEVGVNGFGTYSQLLKDLRLPTAVHNNWLSVQKDEMPIVGTIYDQYIINYYAPSTANPSFTAVGNRSMSETTHVFWVRHDLASAWETAIAGIDPDGGDLNTLVVKEDKRFNNKKAESIVSGN